MYRCVTAIYSDEAWNPKPMILVRTGSPVYRYALLCDGTPRRNGGGPTAPLPNGCSATGTPSRRRDGPLLLRMRSSSVHTPYLGNHNVAVAVTAALRRRDGGFTAP